MAKKTFPKNIGETQDGGHKWDTQLADNAHVIIKQTRIDFMTASGDTPSHLDFLELRTGRLHLTPLPALSLVHSFVVLCSNLQELFSLEDMDSTFTKSYSQSCDGSRSRCVK